MSNEWARLVRVLEDEIELHSELLAVAHEKRQMIVRNDVNGLDAAGGAEERLAGRLRAAEGDREKLSFALAARLGIPPGDARLDRLATSAPEPERSRLLDVGGRLKELVRELGLANAEVRDLLVYALRHIDSFFRLLADSLTQRPTYSPKSVRAAAQVAAGVVDQKA